MSWEAPVLHIPPAMEAEFRDAADRYRRRRGDMTAANLWKLTRKLCRDHYFPRHRLASADFRRRLGDRLAEIARECGLDEGDAAMIRSDVMRGVRPR